MYIQSFIRSKLILVIVFVLLVGDSADIINAIMVRHDKIKTNNALALQNHFKQQWQALKYASKVLTMSTEN